MAQVSSKGSILLINDDRRVLDDQWQQYASQSAPQAAIFKATNAYEARELIRQHEPDVVILDVVLPSSEFGPPMESASMEDIARHSSNLASFYLDAFPSGRLCVVSSYAEAPSIIERFPAKAAFFNPHKEQDVRMLQALMADLSPSESRPVEAGENAAEQQAVRKPKEWSRIRAVREGLFYDDAERSR